MLIKQEDIHRRRQIRNGQRPDGVDDAQVKGHHEAVDDDGLGRNDGQRDHQRNEQLLPPKFQHTQRIAHHAVDEHADEHLNDGVDGRVAEVMQKVELFKHGDIVFERQVAIGNKRLERRHIRNKLRLALDRGNEQEQQRRQKNDRQRDIKHVEQGGRDRLFRLIFHFHPQSPSVSLF